MRGLVGKPEAQDWGRWQEYPTGGSCCPQAGASPSEWGWGPPPSGAPPRAEIVGEVRRGGLFSGGARGNGGFPQEAGQMGAWGQRAHF